MALLIVTGLPCSGRTTRVREVNSYFTERLTQAPSLKSIVVVSDDDVHAEKSVFEHQRAEGRARAAFLSAVRRALTPSTLVIADGGAGMNIKGYRYELWCAVRELGLRCATMHVACAPALARAWNQARLDTQAPDAYTAPCLEELFARFEEPTPEARWHRPLFVVTATGAPGAIDAAPTPCAALWEALTQGNAQAPKGVTAPTRRTTNNSMELLDTVTQQVIAALLAQRSMGTESGTFPLLLAAMPPVSFTMPPGRTFPTPARLQTLRRQFVRIYASKAESDGLALTGNDARPNLAKLFAGWLQEALA